MPGREPLELYFDFISPNAYVAWTQIHEVAARHEREVRYRPVLFAGLLSRYRRLGPGEVGPMSRWMARNCARKAALLGVPFGAPHSHPFNSLLSLRVASLPMEEPARRRVVDRLFLATWGEGLDVGDPGVVERVAAEAGLDGVGAVRDAGADETKRRLREATEAALERGVFGVPTVLVGDELFWGYDDFPYLERFLAGEDPLPREAMARWAAVRPSAVRPEAPKLGGR